VFDANANQPIAVLSLPVVFAPIAARPTAVLLLAVVLLKSEFRPTAVLSLPVVLLGTVAAGSAGDEEASGDESSA